MTNNWHLLRNSIIKFTSFYQMFNLRWAAKTCLACYGSAKYLLFILPESPNMKCLKVAASMGNIKDTSIRFCFQVLPTRYGQVVVTTSCDYLPALRVVLMERKCPDGVHLMKWILSLPFHLSQWKDKKA